MTKPILYVPDAALQDAVAIIARTGAGKSFAARGLVERLIGDGQKCCIMDPTGVWWGLRLDHAGKKSSGLPVVILGGDHADLPIAHDAGALVAKLVIDHRTSFVIDLSEFDVGERNTFCAQFFSALYRDHPRRPLHLIADEADCYAPQKPMPEQRKMASRFEQIVRRGRVKGFRVMMITQRTAVINKDVLNMAGTMVVLNLSGPQDRDAFERWIEYNATPDQARDILSSLPRLAVGEGWVWSPRHGILQHGRFPGIATYDSMRAPTHDEARVALPELTPDLLAQLGKQFNDLAADARANTPEALRARIKELERQLASKAPAAPDPEIERAAYRRGREDIMRALRGSSVKLRHDIGAAIDSMMTSTEIDSPVAAPARPAMVAGQRTVSPRGNGAAIAAGAERKLVKGERAILSALAQHGALRPTQLALMTGYAVNGGGFRNYLSALRQRGLIGDRDGRLEITESGHVACGPVEELPAPGPELLRMWLGRLYRAERAIMKALARAYPDALLIEDVAAQAGYAADGGGFRNSVSKLRTLELIERAGGAYRIAPTIMGRS